MRPTLITITLLSLLMWITRGSHFDSIYNLPDASLAIFLAAGFYLRKTWPLIWLMALAALLDYVAITYNGVSDFCVSPAYFFLIPTYACMWLAGRWLAARYKGALKNAVELVFASVISTNIAFHISSGSFYLISGRFSDLSWATYGERVAAYLPSYVTIACGYIALFAVLHIIMAQLARKKAVIAK